jgi:cell division septation protein DedD
MSELARLRDARSIEVSRGHVQAWSVTALSAIVAAFALGFWLGRSNRPDAQVHAPSLVEVVPGTDLVALLAEIERSTLATASPAMKYPELLEDGSAAPVPTRAPESATLDATISATGGSPTFVPDPTPEGAFTVQLGAFEDADAAKRLRTHLEGREQPVWWTLVRTDGKPRFTVSVGAYPSREAADDAVPAIAAATSGSGVNGVAAKVIPIAPKAP